MKTASKCLAAFLLLAGVSGCGDAPNILIHDVLVFWNEVCDNMLRATDDTTAGSLLKVQFKALALKQESLLDRCNKKMLNIGKEEAQDLDDALVDFYDEIVATEARLAHSEERLKAIMENTSGDTGNLKKILEWPKTMMKFKDVNLGDFRPDPNRFAKLPKQFGLGLVPMRPQLDKTPKIKIQ